MLQIHALGPLSVDGLATRRRLALVAGEKRLALFLYLLLHGRGGVIRRDLLLPLLWPDADESHARSALRSLVREVRSAVGDGVVVNEGDHALGVDVTKVRCDVLQFEAACGGGEWERAVELYRGRLLDGFGVSGAAGFEEWLEGERARLAAQALDACRALAAEAMARGAHDTAVRALRKALTNSPYDERVVRELMEVLEGAGDRAGALLAYDEFVARLKKDLEVEVGAETVAVAERVRESSRRGGEAVLTGSGDRVISEGPPPSAGTIRRPAHVPMRAFRWAATSAVLAALFGMLLWPMLRERIGASSPTADNRFAIFPFEVHTGGGLSYTGEAVMTLMSDAINGLGELRSVDPRALRGALAREGIESVSIPEAQRVSRRFGAGTLIIGTVVEAGSGIRLSASLYDASGGPEPRMSVQSEGAESNLSGLVTQLARGLLAHERLGPGARLADLSAVEAGSFAALKAWVVGEAALRRGQYDSALSSMERAVEEDTAFALAWHRLMFVQNQAAVQARDESRAFELVLASYRSADRALRLKGRLSRRDRLMAEAWHAHIHGDGVRAESLCVTAVSDYPEYVEAWWWLGALRWFWSWQLGRSPSEARPALIRALELDPESADAMYRLAMLTALEGRYREVDSILDTAQRRGLWVLLSDELRAVAMFGQGTVARQDSFIASLETSSDIAMWSANLVASFSDDLRGADRILSVYADPARWSADSRATSHMLRAQLQVSGGRWQGARAELAALSESKPTIALVYEALFGAAPLLEVTGAELERLRDSLIRWEPPPSESPEWILFPVRYGFPSNLSPYLRTYLVGLLDARLGNETDARRAAARLRGALEPADTIGLLPDLALEILALAAASNGRYEEALTLAASATLKVGWEFFFVESPLHSRPLIRYLRAEALRQLGRFDEAVGWYSAFALTGGYEDIFLSRAHLGLADIYERQGDAQSAVRHYTRFAKRWRDANSRLQPLVQRARDKAADLSRD